MAVPTPLPLPRPCSPSARDQPPPPGILDTNGSNGYDSWDSGSRRMSDGWQTGPVDDIQHTMNDSSHQQQTRRQHDSVAAGRPDRMAAIAEEQQQQQKRSTKDVDEEETRGRSDRGGVPRRQRAVSAGLTEDKANGNGNAVAPAAAAGGGARDIENRKKNTTPEACNGTDDRPLSPGTTNRPSNGASLHDPVKRETLNGDRKSGQTLSSSPSSVMGLGLDPAGEKQTTGTGTTTAASTGIVSLPEESGEEGGVQIDGTDGAGGAKNQERDPEKILKLSPTKMQELTSSPESIPYRAVPDSPEYNRRVVSDNMHTAASRSGSSDGSVSVSQLPADIRISSDLVSKIRAGKDTPLDDTLPPSSASSLRNRPHASRTVSTPSSTSRRQQHQQQQQQQQPSSNSERLAQTWASRTKQDRVSVVTRPEGSEAKAHLSPSPQITESGMPSPMPQSIPLPPVSIPTYLQLELASGRPSPLYIHHSATNDFPYESARVKLERLVNFLMLPPAVEQVLWFGLFACLDAWLYSFTILPLRFVKAVYILLESWAMNLSVEFRYVSGFVYNGIWRVWRRRNKPAASTAQDRGAESDASLRRASTAGQDTNASDREMRARSGTESRRRHPYRHHRRQKSIPSALLPDDKADILKGLLMITTCWVLMYFDASRMYHWIRGQAAIKLYVIYNVLEVSDRLFAAIGQDVLECLFSREALERRPDGRSKVFRPFGLFLLALAYTVIHATSLFYQVMTLNVAVNSYSNALITLLLSNQFVEIKSTVFKKFEKENLFQLTCADVVERFQLWLMLTIIASRNIVETGAFNFVGSLGSSWSTGGGNSSTSTNSTPLSTPPRTASSILPQSFTIFPSSLISSFSKVNSFLPSLAQVLGPFLVVLGSEMLVDWLKHAYINKFNNTRPTIYGRFLDVLAKDYYTNAFGDQNLTRRLGLPVIPLSCLFFRVSVQTYKMFLAASLPQQPSSSTAVEATRALSSIHRDYAPAPAPSMPPLTLRTLVLSSVAYFSAFFRTALANAMPSPAQSVYIFTAILIIALFIVLLIFKLVLGMGLLAFARSRYKAMKGTEMHHTHHHNNHHHHHNHNHHNNNTSNALANGGAGTGTQQREHPNFYTVEGSRRAGGWGVVEVNEDKRRWIYADDPEALKQLKAKEEKAKKSTKEGESWNMDHVQRYEMVAKRIW